MIKMKLVKIAAVTAAIPLVGVALASAGPGDPAQPPVTTVAASSEPPPHEAAPSPQSHGPLSQWYSVLGRDKHAGDTPPSDAHPDPEDDPAAARRAVVGVYGEVFAVPAGPTKSEALCVVATEASGTGGGSACSDASSARDQGVFVVRQCFDEQRPFARVVLGLAPDGVSSVSLNRDGQVLSRTAVQSNGFEVASDSASDTLRLGERRVRLPPVVC